MRNRGSAIVVVLIIAVLLLLIGTGLLSLGLKVRLYAIRSAFEVAARSASDAGLTKAFFDMNQKLLVTPWNDSDLPHASNVSLPNTDSTYSYTVTKDANGVYVIRSIGQSGTSTKTTSASLRLSGLFDNAIIVLNSLTLKNNNTITGYDSSGSGATNIPVQIGTVSSSDDSISLGNNTTIYGDAFSPPGSDPTEVISGGAVTGNEYALSQSITLPTITPPALTTPNTALNLSGNTTIGTAGGSYNAKYTSIGVNGNKLIINGNVTLYVAGTIDMGNSGVIQINSNSSLTIYLDGNFNGTNGNGIINTDQIPAGFKLFATGSSTQTINFKNNTNFYGAVYAPNANVTFQNNPNIYGSVIAKSFTTQNNCNFYYDYALQNGQFTDFMTHFVIKRWTEQ